MCVPDKGRCLATFSYAQFSHVTVTQFRVFSIRDFYSLWRLCKVVLFSHLGMSLPCIAHCYLLGIHLLMGNTQSVIIRCNVTLRL